MINVRLVMVKNFMTNKEKKIQIALGTYLDTVWNEGKKLRDKGYKLWDKGNKLYDKGNELFNNAVIEVYGKDITIKYMSRNKCKLSNGQVFE